MGKCPHSWAAPTIPSPSICTLTLRPELPGTPGKPEIRQSTKEVTEITASRGGNLGPLLIAPKSWSYPRYSPAGRARTRGGQGAGSPGLPGAPRSPLGPSRPCEGCSQHQDPETPGRSGVTYHRVRLRGQRLQKAFQHSFSLPRRPNLPSLPKEDKAASDPAQSEPRGAPSEGNSPSSRLLQN